MRRFFVTATDTGVGKTEVACALLAELAERTPAPFAFKPYESGSAGESDGARLRRAAGSWQPLDRVTLHRFRAALAPGIAARLEGRRPSWRRVLSTFAGFGSGPGVVEGAGGLFVPLDARHDVLDLIRALRLPAVVVARAGLGTVNHTTLTLAALRRAGVRIAAVILVSSTRRADPSVRFNRAELERRFPRVRFLGPIPYTPVAGRSRAFRRVVRPLLAR